MNEVYPDCQSLSVSEALQVSESFLISLYSLEVYKRWTELKFRMNFTTEREFVTWIMDRVEQTQGQNKPTAAAAADNGGAAVGSRVEGADQQQRRPVAGGTNISGGTNRRSQRSSCSKPQALDSQGLKPTTAGARRATACGDYYYYDDFPVGGGVPEIEFDTPQPFATPAARQPQHKGLASRGRRVTKPAQAVAARPGAGPALLLPCPQCPKRFRSRALVRDHVRYVHQSAPPSHRCPHCPADAPRCFKRERELQRHLVSRHQYHSQLRCQRCLKYFPTSEVKRFERHVGSCREETAAAAGNSTETDGTIEETSNSNRDNAPPREAAEESVAIIATDSVNNRNNNQSSGGTLVDDEREESK